VHAIDVAALSSYWMTKPIEHVPAVAPKWRTKISARPLTSKSKINDTCVTSRRFDPSIDGDTRSIGEPRWDGRRREIYPPLL